MSDLIDRDKLLNSMFADDPKDFFGYIADFPYVDAVEVVRCKDCKFWHEDVANFVTSIPRGGCKLIRGLTNSEFFCAMGERKE